MGCPRTGYKTTRCVRADDNGVYFLPKFTDNGDGTVTDQVTHDVVADRRWSQT